MLDGVASAMWRAVTGEQPWSEVRPGLMRRYKVAEAQLDADLAAFAAEMRAAGILTEVDSRPAPGAATQRLRRDWIARVVPAALGAWLTLHATAAALRGGFRPAYRGYARFARGASRDAGHDADPDAEKALAAFGHAEHLFIARRAPDDCLVRSLALFRHLNARGVAAEHVIGVCRLPFQAHAWVEVAGLPVLDGIARNGDFTPIARLGGRS